jgi:hypothetical protein
LKLLIALLKGSLTIVATAIFSILEIGYLPKWAAIKECSCDTSSCGGTDGGYLFSPFVIAKEARFAAAVIPPVFGMCKKYRLLLVFINHFLYFFKVLFKT